MFEQHARWLEELREYTDRKEAITCRAGYMSLTAITQEIADAAADPRTHDHMHVDNWESMAADLFDSVNWVGPELLALVDTPARTLHQAITNGLLTSRPGRRAQIDDTQRPVVAAQTAGLANVLDQDDVLVAAWRDLVTACGDVDHARYPSERIAFLRDTLISLGEYRNQDRRHFSPISTAVDVLTGNQFSVQQAQAMVGDPVDADRPDPYAESNLTEAERADLAARCIIKRPAVGKYVVWFRLSPGYFVGSDACVTHGDITFYEAQMLVQVLIHQDRASQWFDVLPEELLTDEIRDLERSDKVNDHTGFEHLPGLVYARVTVHDVERHRAVETARMHLHAVLAAVGVNERMWKVLGGNLFYDGSPYSLMGARWGLKEPLPEQSFYQNDHFAKDLAKFTADGYLITAEIAQQLQPALRLLSALEGASPDDSEAIVMAAVRAIEHCNTWTVPLAGHRWYGFVDEYLADWYTLRAFGQRVVVDVFLGADRYEPDRTPGAPSPPELHAIRNDIILDPWGTRIDSPKAIAHVAALRRIYGNHWLVRRLAESDDILSSAATLGAAFDAEKLRVAARVRRLTRSRNAAIHGGPLSDAACGTITDFAAALARQALHTTIWAVVTGQQVDAHATSQRDEFRQRISNLKQGRDLENLFRLTP